MSLRSIYFTFHSTYNPGVSYTGGIGNEGFVRTEDNLDQTSRESLSQGFNKASDEYKAHAYRLIKKNEEIFKEKTYR